MLNNLMNAPSTPHHMHACLVGNSYRYSNLHFNRTSLFWIFFTDPHKYWPNKVKQLSLKVCIFKLRTCDQKIAISPSLNIAWIQKGTVSIGHNYFRTQMTYRLTNQTNIWNVMKQWALKLNLNVNKAVKPFYCWYFYLKIDKRSLFLQFG